MMEHKPITHSPLRLFFKPKPAARPRLESEAKAKYQRPKDDGPPPETDPKILIEHYAHLGRGPL